MLREIIDIYNPLRRCKLIGSSSSLLFFKRLVIQLSCDGLRGGKDALDVRFAELKVVVKSLTDQALQSSVAIIDN